MTDHLTENARLRAALEFYANPDAWNQPPVRTLEGLFTVEYENEASKIQRDRGKIARAALATPAPDAVQDAARVPTAREIVDAWLDENENFSTRRERMIGYCCRNHTSHNLMVDWLVAAADATLRAISGDRT